MSATETVEAVSKRVEANRRNAARSTGPKSADGKSRVRLNALKHGLTAKSLVLPGENAELLEARVEAWKHDLKPQSPLEDYLVERAVHVSWQLDRTDRAIAAKLNDLVRYGAFDQAEAEGDEVEDLARRLFWDPRGPIALYPHFRGFRVNPRVSWPDSVDDPLNPARIINHLESLAKGCRWLLDRWTDLRRLLEDGLKWQAPDRLRAIRLLGRQPMDALADQRVMAIYLCCDAMEPTAPSSLDDLRTETDDDELELYKERVRGRGGDWRKPKDPESGRQFLLSLIDHTMMQLGGLLGAHRERQEFEATVRPDLLAFDESPEGELMRRYQLAKGREFYRTISTYYKVQREALASAGDDWPATGGATIEPESIPVAGPESVGWVQPTDANPEEPAGYAEGSSAPPTPADPGPEHVTGDETNPIPAERAGDETNPIPAELPIPAVGELTLMEYIAADMARVDGCGPLEPILLEALKERERRSLA